jgi:4-hydroxybenzoate polyprenyltransferase
MSQAQPSHLRLVFDAVSIARFHIVAIAMTATVVFGWLMTGRYLLLLALVAGADWFVINLVNRITDIDEDLRNGIPGTERVARDRRAFSVLAWATVLGSFAVTAVVWPALLPARLVVQLIGLGYNYRIVPSPRGFTRFKELYFFKNFMSAVLFVLTGFAYPLLVAERQMPWAAIATLVVFFVPFELTYEILYDFRDLEGDRAEGIPTYPVVHGPRTARRIIDALLVLSAATLVLGLLAGWLGVREALMLAAPAVQAVLYRAWLRRPLTSRDCILLTHVGTAMLILYVAGTALWLRWGGPPNLWLVGS